MVVWQRVLAVPFLVKPHCRSCHWEWPVAIVGDGKHFLFTCASCKNVVGSARVGFKSEYERCAQCFARLTARDAIDISGPLTAKCPRCSTGEVVFEDVMHFRIRADDVCPVLGEVVHGMVKGYTLYVPGLYLRCGRISARGIPDGAADIWLELRTTNITSHEDTIDLVEFDYVRYARHENAIG